MKAPQLITSKAELPLSQIDLGTRLRPVSEAGVATIIASLREVGQMTNPVVVRQLRRGGKIIYMVVDGAHRMAAAKELGWDHVPVRVFECTDDQARIMEIDGNLSGAELNPLDTAVFLATRKAVYERLHPETAHATGAALAAKRWDATDSMSAAFAAVTAEKFGMTERHVRRLIAAGARLGQDEVARLRAAPRQVTLKDLQDIAMIKGVSDRHDVVAALSEGRAKNASAALKALKGPVETPVQNPADEQLMALLKAWDRAGTPVLRRFVAERFDALSPLVVDEAEARDSADIQALRMEMPGVAAE